MEAELFEKICSDLERTHLGLLSICRNNGLATENAFRNHLKKSELNEERYTRAREKQLDYLEDLLREVSFESSKDSLVDGTVNLGSNSIARDRLKVDTLKFILSKLRPQKYGTKIEHTIKSEPRVFKID
jgi:hypothetical protein